MWMFKRGGGGDIREFPGVQRKNIWTEYRKVRTRNNSVFGHFSRSVYISTLHYKYTKLLIICNITTLLILSFITTHYIAYLSPQETCS